MPPTATARPSRPWWRGTDRWSLATCRAVLRHEHDVEDAFQATFLVLARKAGSVRGGDALGGWLHRVAYRVAVAGECPGEGGVGGAKSEASAMAIADAARPGLDPEIASIVHEEVDRLPDGLRLPVVLCDLEGLTYEQAAGRLHWTEPTLRHRLVKARQRLRDRLSSPRRDRRGAGRRHRRFRGHARRSRRRGRKPAVAAATGGAGSMAAVALTRIILRNMLMTRLKIAAVSALVVVGIASAGVFAIGAGRPDEPGARDESARPLPRSRRPPGTTGSRPRRARSIEVRGRVVGPDGKPVAGATLRTAYLDPDDARARGDQRAGRPVPHADPAGRSGTPTSCSTATTSSPGSSPRPRGSGPAGLGASLKAAAPGELTVRLVEDGPPIEGRIVDLEGRPVAGAQVKAERL